MVDAEPLIIDRIKATVPGIKTVISHAALPGTNELAIMLPMAIVRPASSDVRDIAGNMMLADGLGGSVILTEVETWAIALLAKNDRTYKRQEVYQKTLGPLAMEVVKALHGWRPGDGFETVVYTGHGEFDADEKELQVVLNFEVAHTWAVA